MERFDAIDVAQNLLRIRCPNCANCWHDGYHSKDINENPYQLDTKKYHHWKNGYRIRQIFALYNCHHSLPYQQQAANDEIYSCENGLDPASP